MEPLTLHTPLTSLPGVGPAREKALDKLGLRTVADLLAYFPRDYEDRRQMYTIREAPLRPGGGALPHQLRPPGHGADQGADRGRHRSGGGHLL